MVIDDELTANVRTALVGVRGIREVRMFGGIAFMMNGNMLIAASGRGLMARVGRDRESEALGRSGARPVVMHGRRLRGYVRIDRSALDGGTVGRWIYLAMSFVKTLPARRPKAKAKTALKKAPAKRARRKQRAAAE